MSKYHEYRAKARKWDELVEFIRNDNHITNIIPINDLSTLRISKELGRLRYEKVKKLVHLDILGESL